MENLIILGTGIAGCTAAVYAARANLKPLLISGPEDGGQLTLTTDVENFPGFPDGVKGPELVALCKKQAERFGARFLVDIVESCEKTKNGFDLKLMGGDTLQTKALIVATGASARWLGISSEEKYKGRGVTTCATCLPADSMIIANNSPKKIQNIEEGQRVLTHDGTFQKVVGVANRDYDGKLIRFSSRYFRDEPTVLTPEHPILVTTMKRGNGSKYRNIEWSEPHWVLAGELQKEHILLYPIVKEIKDVETVEISKLLDLPVDKMEKAHYNNETYTARRISNSILISNNFMRLAGYFLAEGSITPRGINFYFGFKEEAYAEDVAMIMNSLFDYKVTIKREHPVIRVECYAGIIRDFFEKLFGKFSYGKSIPHWFVYLPFDKQKELLRGYFRGDGCMRKEDFVLVTNSPQLVTQFKTILLRLGVIPSIQKRSKDDLNKSKNVYKGREIKFKHDRYQITVGGSWLEVGSDIFGVIHPHLNERVRSNSFAWIREGFANLPINSIDTVDYKGEVYNIAVENNNTYVTPCATVHNCDGAFFKDKEVVVIGGGDSAMEEANFLTKFASKVTIIHRKDVFRASKIMEERALKNPKIKVVWNAEIAEIVGDGKRVNGVKLKDTVNGKISDFKCDGVFLAIGHVPNTSFLKGMIEVDELGYIKADKNMHTTVSGLFAAGDVQDRHFRQAITAAGSGCMAAMEAEKYLAENGEQ